MFFLSVVLQISCSSTDDESPAAGFSLSDDNPTQFDKVNIVDQSKEANDINYEILGGEYSISPDQSSIVFFEDHTYTITQIITNNVGSDSFSITINVDRSPNKYILDGNELPINDSAFWFDASNTGGTIYIKLLVDVEGNENPNVIKLFPVSGNNPIQATYVWGNKHDIGTYDAGMLYNWKDGNDYDWISKGKNGEHLKIELFYEDPYSSDDNAYIITLPSYTLNYGYWNWISGSFIKEGEKTFSLYYKGKINPHN